MNLNSNLKTVDTLSARNNTEPIEPSPFHYHKATPFTAVSNDHSRKTSQGSAKSLPYTCSSWSANSDIKSSRTDKKLRELFNEINKSSKGEGFYRVVESKGDEPYEISTQTEAPKLIWCAFCKAENTTHTVYANSSETLTNSIAIFLLGGVLGCFLLPFITKSCKEQKTTCSKCGHLIRELTE